ncbi:MAG: SCO family protein [Pyrinomonadaceae bacterium]
MPGSFKHHRPFENSKRRALCLMSIGALLFLIVMTANAQRSGGGLYSRPPDATQQPTNITPETLKDIGIDQRLNEQLPLDAVFHDEEHKAIKLGDFFGQGKPVIVALVYYECPMLCNQVLNGLLNGLKEVPFNVGEEYNVVVVSFDPREDKNPDLPQAKKKTYLHYYLQDGTRPADKAKDGWHFLTGEQKEIEKLANAVGFHYKYDPVSEQYAHASGIMIATPAGKLARYYYGIQYVPKDLRLGIVEASQNKIASPVDKILLYCFHYDPTTGKYGAVIMNIVKIGGVLTIIGLAALIIGLSIGAKSVRKRAERDAVEV